MSGELLGETGELEEQSTGRPVPRVAATIQLRLPQRQPLAVQERAHRGRRLLLHVGQDVRVGVQGNLDPRVTEPLRHNVHRFPGLQQQSCAPWRMPWNVMAFTFAMRNVCHFCLRRSFPSQGPARPEVQDCAHDV